MEMQCWLRKNLWFCGAFQNFSYSTQQLAYLLRRQKSNTLFGITKKDDYNLKYCNLTLIFKTFFYSLKKIVLLIV